MAEAHESELVGVVFRREILWVEVVRIDKILLIGDNIFEINVNNPPFRNDEISVGDLVVFGTFSLVRFHQRIKSRKKVFVPFS